MKSGVEQLNLHSQRLHADYREAFRDWAMQVRRLRSMAVSGDRVVLHEAEARVEAAEVAYRDSRNRLTDDMENGSW